MRALRQGARTEKAREREPVFHPFAGQVAECLQDQWLEHEQGIERIATGIGFTRLLRRQFGLSVETGTSFRSLLRYSLMDRLRAATLPISLTQRSLFSCPRMICPRKVRKNTEGRRVFFSVSSVFSVDPLFFIRVDSCAFLVPNSRDSWFQIRVIRGSKFA